MRRTAVARPAGWLRLNPGLVHSYFRFIRRAAESIARGESTVAGVPPRRGGRSAGTGHHRP